MTDRIPSLQMNYMQLERVPWHAEPARYSPDHFTERVSAECRATVRKAHSRHGALAQPPFAPASPSPLSF